MGQNDIQDNLKKSTASVCKVDTEEFSGSRIRSPIKEACASTSSLDSPTLSLNNFSRVSKKFHTILADPPWQFQNRTGKIAPEHKRLNRYDTLSLKEIKQLPVKDLAADPAHLYLWVPNALLNEGLEVMSAWGFTYKTNIIWYKIRKDGGPDGRGVGFYFRNVTEIILFGVRGKNARTLNAGRSQVNLVSSRKREHSRKPDEIYEIIESCSNGPYLELFARGKKEGWEQWGNQVEDYTPTWNTYSNHSQIHQPNFNNKDYFKAYKAI